MNNKSAEPAATDGAFAGGLCRQIITPLKRWRSVSWIGPIYQCVFAVHPDIYRKLIFDTPHRNIRAPFKAKRPLEAHG
jgi:hypothetical protein